MRELFRSRLAMYIYLVGIIQVAVIVFGLDFYVSHFLPPPPSTLPEQASYVAHRLEAALQQSTSVEWELKSANDAFLSHIALRDPDGRVVPAGGVGCRAEEHDGPSMCEFAPVQFADGRFGRVEVSVDDRPRPPIYLPSFIAFAMLVVGVGSWIFTRTLTRPLQRMCTAAGAFGAGHLDARVGGKRRDELGQLARSFDEMAERIQNLLNAERELMGSVSHELRTPLARIRVALDLGNEGDAEAMRDALGEIGGDLDELERLVDDVLTTTRLAVGNSGPKSSGLGALRLQKVDPAGLARDAVRRFRSAHASRPVVVDLPEQLPLLTADPALLHRALGNLLDNAHKYTLNPEESIKLSVRGGNGIEFDVVDQGIGIPQSDLASVFQPFFRSDRSRTRATGGFGLGLALVKRIAEAHGGTVEIESTPEQGTRAMLRLPLDPHGADG